jgi:acetyl-CoA carboxylase biotin carboxylase subunit
VHFWKNEIQNGGGNRIFKRVLIANRGEIALRIIKTCQEMGITTIAVYSDADVGSPHVMQADESYPLGDPAVAESYLNIEKIIKGCKEMDAEAVHPGYGFLSENPEFAQSCDDEGIVFIGPGADAIALMGNKVEAKQKMENAEVPVIPGYHGGDLSIDKLVAEGESIGFPLIVKASAGGGGKGMHIVRDTFELRTSIESASREARSAFGDATVFLEKYLEKPRHIEIQVLADNNGNIVHLFERECSIQRRHQKVIEETPSLALTPALREEMGEAAVRAAKSIGYRNAGTIEFMMDAEGNYYFMEMNTRLQVEHAITEYVTGIDIVRWQLRIAAGEELTLKQPDLIQRGHAIECRIYAEDPERGFLPSTGILTKVELPSGVNIRHDVGITTGLEITPYYDPMLAKLIAFGENRQDAIQKMIWALGNYVALGVTTNIRFLKAVLEHSAFQAGAITTHFIDDHFKNWGARKEQLPAEVLTAAAVADYIALTSRNGAGSDNGAAASTATNDDPHSPWKSGGKWRISPTFSKADHSSKGGGV